MGIPGQPPAVLVVDDELLIRMDLAATIEESGFKVYEAANADQAVEILEKVEDITVLLTDVNMPGSMNGGSNSLITPAHIGPSKSSSRRAIATLKTRSFRRAPFFQENPYGPQTSSNA
jgi:CheY-like chemotaxis protein